MSSIGNSNAAYESRKFLKEGDREISERAFNAIIGAVLLWGFLLNYAMVALFGQRIAYAVAGMSPWIFLIGYFAMVIAGSKLIAKDSPALSFAGYNLIAVPLGVCVCVCLQGYAVDTVRTAVLLTAVVTLSMMIAGTLFPRFFLSLGRMLFFTLLTCTIGHFVTTLLFGYNFIYEWIFTGIFSLYIAYDWARANQCARTVDNAIDLAAELYIDIINLFLRILRILGRSRNND